MPDPQTAARRFATEYQKTTGQPVRVFVDARRGNLIEEGYVHWLETELGRARRRLLPEPERPPARAAPRPPAPRR